MSRTIKGSKPQGYEYWSRRPCNSHCANKFAKKCTHKTERATAKAELKQEGEYIQPDFDFERLKRAVECGSVEVPKGMSFEEFDAWLCGVGEKQEGLIK